MAAESNSNHTIRAQTEIRKRILSGELAGGERLFEVPLAEMLSISRTPVREAMSRLAEEGLLERAKSTGFVVRTFGVEDVIDGIELRGVLEGTAARLAAERGPNPDLLEQMREVLNKIDTCFRDDSTDFEIYSKANAEFHDLLRRLSGSKILEWELDRVIHLPFASPSAFLPDKVNLETRHLSLVLGQAQHREILAAIEAREGTRAEALAREHARTARRDLEEAMKNKDDSSQMPNLALVIT
jgi:GntR family transcriptional regulator, vanillate catabolism transcriptional regulator